MYDRVLVRKLKPETVRASGLILATTLRENTEEGVIVQVGTGKVTSSGDVIPVQVNIGDTVMFLHGAGTSVNINGDKFTIINESELIAVTTEGE